MPDSVARPSGKRRTTGFYCRPERAGSELAKRCIVVVFITGATGFLGRHLVQALHAAGHEVVCAVRNPQGRAARRLPAALVEADFVRLTRAPDWRPLLAGVDVVVNAVGILRETGGQRFGILHSEAPRALFDACVAAGVTRVVQISALGADSDADTAYLLSKREADDHLLSLPLSGVVAQPSLVYGEGGASARLFTAWASLPVLPLPGRAGDAPIQPIHIDDLVAALQALVTGDGQRGERVPLVGPRPLSLKAFLAALRAGMRLGRGRWLRLPDAWMRVAARAGEHLPASLLDRDTLTMLERGNHAPADATARLLGRAPRDPAGFIRPSGAEATAALARMTWLLPLLRWSVAAVWIVTGILSLGVYPIGDSLALLAAAGVPETFAMPLLLGGGLADLALGIATLAWRGRWLWWAQIALMGAYTVIITVQLPEFWLHPFGPILKNIPLLAVIGVLLAFEPRRERQA